MDVGDEATDVVGVGGCAIVCVIVCDHETDAVCDAGRGEVVCDDETDSACVGEGVGACDEDPDAACDDVSEAVVDTVWLVLMEEACEPVCEAVVDAVWLGLIVAAWERVNDGSSRASLTPSPCWRRSLSA